VEAVLHGGPPCAVVAAVGVWDPLQSPHKELFARLRAHGRPRGLKAAAVVLDPDPVRFLWGPAELPVYDDIHTRVHLLLSSGLDRVVLVRFRRRDLYADAADLLSAVRGCVQLEELWLGARQTLGRGDGNSFEAIVELGARLGVAVERLAFTRLATHDVRDLLAAGRIGEAAKTVGRPPIRSRPRTGTLRLAWRPGTYTAAPLEDLDSLRRGIPIRLRLHEDASRLPKLDWPSSAIRHLAFVAGPADETPADEG
jgi:FAD synthetase